MTIHDIKKKLEKDILQRIIDAEKEIKEIDDSMFIHNIGIAENFLTITSRNEKLFERILTIDIRIR